MLTPDNSLMEQIDKIFLSSLMSLPDESDPSKFNSKVNFDPDFR